jgi:hypothetical protein
LAVERLGFPEGIHHEKNIIKCFNSHDATFHSFINKKVLERYEQNKKNDVCIFKVSHSGKTKTTKQKIIIMEEINFLPGQIAE